MTNDEIQRRITAIHMKARWNDSDRRELRRLRMLNRSGNHPFTPSPDRAHGTQCQSVVNGVVTEYNSIPEMIQAEFNPTSKDHVIPF